MQFSKTLTSVFIFYPLSLITDFAFHSNKVLSEVLICYSDFPQVGRALGVSVLDLTSSNPCSRIPNSEYRSVNGIRDWLRSNCLSDSQLWTRMLHRPTRPQVLKKTLQHETTNPNLPNIPVSNSSYIPNCTNFVSPLPFEVLDSSLDKIMLESNCRNFSNYVLETIGKSVSLTSAKSEDTVGGVDNLDRWYDRKKALEYEQELETERVKVFEKCKFILSSEKEKAYKSNFENDGFDHTSMKSCDSEKYCSEFRAALEEELATKREKAKKIREHDRLVHERFGKTGETRQLERARHSITSPSLEHDLREEWSRKLTLSTTIDKDEVKFDGRNFILDSASCLEDDIFLSLETNPSIAANVDKISQNLNPSAKAGSPGIQNLCQSSSPDKSLNGTDCELRIFGSETCQSKAPLTKIVAEVIKPDVTKLKYPTADGKRKGERFRLKDMTRSKVPVDRDYSSLKRKELIKKEALGSGQRWKSLYQRKDPKVKRDGKAEPPTTESTQKSQNPSDLSKNFQGKSACINNVTVRRVFIKEEVTCISLPPVQHVSETLLLSDGQILQYGSQTDSDIREVMLNEIKRINCMGSNSNMICRDKIIPVLQSGTAHANNDPITHRSALFQ